MKTLILITSSLILAYIYRGFYFPDPQYLKSPGLPVLLLGLRALFPIFAVSVLVLIWLLMSKRLPLLYVGLVLTSSLLAVLIIYPPGSYWYYKRSFRHKSADYHTYLQLTPPAYQPSREASKDAIRIFFLGGSSTSWPDTNKIDWPSRVEEQLRLRFPHKNIHASNLAKEWYTSLHTLINYSTNLQQHSPHIIVITHALNDLLHNADFNYFSGGSFREDYGHFYGPVSGIIRRRTLPDTFLNLLSSYWYFPERQVITTDQFPGLKSFRRNLSTIVRLAHSNGAQVLLQSQPNLYRPDLTSEEKAALYMLNVEAVGPDKRWSYETAASGMQQYNQVSREVAAEHGATFFDLEQSIPKSLEYFTDDVHYTDRAFPLLAEKVTEPLADLIEKIRTGSRESRAE